MRIPINFSEAISFTLLHSLWQALLVVLLLKVILNFISTEKSSVRYLTAGTAMLVFFLGSLITFVHYYDPSEITATTLEKSIVINKSQYVKAEIPIAKTLIHSVESYRDFILIGWLCGCGIFLLRIAAGWWYLFKLRNSAIAITNSWAVRLKQIASDLQINISVRLAESADVLSPMVIGVVRPLIILPMGLSTGLTTDQIEAIFIHELVHIKRNDFLFNILQSLLEALFFFNPFVWMISSIVRSEREHCCDDAVVQSGVDAKAYVYALASLEEIRISKSPLAMSLTGNKNELLQRIKRLMEKSVKNYSYREKLIPVLFLVVGLICASWFSIQKGDTSATNLDQDKLVAQDTTIKKKSKAATVNRKKEVTVVPDGIPHEEVTEEFEGDESLLPLMQNFEAMADFEIPPIPFEEMMLHPLPGHDVDLLMPHFPPMAFDFDSIPPFQYSGEQWEEFQREFQEKFQERFGEFYAKNQSEIQKMMEEFQQDYQKEFQHPMIDLQENLFHHSEGVEEHAKALAEHEKDLKRHEQDIREFEKNMKNWEKEHAEHLKELEENMKKFEGKMKAFEQELKTELIKDGYIKSSEKIENIHWKDNGDIEVNGVKVKDSDMEKYRKLHDKYFDDKDGEFHYVE